MKNKVIPEGFMKGIEKAGKLANKISDDTLDAFSEKGEVDSFMVVYTLAIALMSVVRATPMKKTTLNEVIDAAWKCFDAS